MMSARELLQKVLDECGADGNLYHISPNLFGEIASFLKRPEPEPIGFMRDDGDGWFEFSSHDDEGAFPVYTTTPDQSARIAELAKSEPEPIGFINPLHLENSFYSARLWKERGCNGINTPVYAEPPQRKPLSDDV